MPGVVRPAVDKAAAGQGDATGRIIPYLRVRKKRMEWLRMGTLVGAVVRFVARCPDGPWISALDFRPTPRPRLMVATSAGIKNIALNEKLLRRYSRTFDFERARRWLLREIRNAPAA